MFDVLKSPTDVPWLSETMTTILIMLLNGPNYATWKVQCKLALMKEGLWNFVTGDENAPEIKENKQNTCCEEIVL